MCPNYFHNLCHNLYTSLWNTTIRGLFRKKDDSNHLKEEVDYEEEDPEVLRFWVPQRSFSTQSGAVETYLFLLSKANILLL